MMTLTETDYKKSNQPWQYRLRIWLIKKLAGRDGIILNARVGAPILSKNGERVFVDKTWVTDQATGATAYFGR